VIEPERRAAELRTLLARMSHQRGIIDRVSQRLDRTEERAASGSDPEAVAATALYLQHFYTGIEDALLRAAEALDGAVPSGEDWHRLLLEQMALDIPDVRPALLTLDLHRHLDVLRRFRHRVRHAYDEDYAWNKMDEPRAARAKTRELLPGFFGRLETVVRGIIAGLEAG
jgi:hypothetical protein